jgi:peptidoglycan/LPS O-acetylase OafA/YrhL
MSLKEFAVVRVVRLYPLYGLGVTLAALSSTVMLVLGRDGGLSARQILGSLGFEFFMLPSPITNAGHDLFPLNNPAWSLFLEIAVNLAFGFLALRLRLKSLVTIVLLAAVGLAIGAISHGTLLQGWTWDSLWMGAMRAAFSFPLGVLIHRMGIVRNRRVSLLCLLPLPLVLLAIDFTPPAGLLGVSDLLVALVASPLLLIAGASVEPPVWLRTPFSLLGEASYPLYAVHAPLIVAAVFLGHKVGIPDLPLGIGLVIGLVAAAIGLSRLYDAPLRRAVTAQLRESGISTAVKPA